jgi:UDP-glucose 4-epimerase
MERVLITGAAGFMGAAALPALQRAGYALRATWHRHAPRDQLVGVEWRQDDLLAVRDRTTDLLRGVDIVIHLAARVHVSGLLRHWSAPFHRANVVATTQLAQQAARAGVRRFVFLSTVGVHGRDNRISDGLPQALRADDPLQPQGAYARSKLAAELALTQTCAGSGMELVTLRAPLVFGPGNGGNFLRLLQFLDYRLPLPAGPQPAPRSLVYADNLSELLLVCLTHSGVANRTFVLADFDLAVTVLAGKLADLLGRRLRTLQLPDFLLRSGALRNLTQPLLIDGLPIREITGWQPGIGPDAALAQTVAWYRSSR